MPRPGCSSPRSRRSRGAWQASRLPASPPRLDEDAFSFDGDALIVGEMSCGEGLYAVPTGDPGFRVQLTEPGKAQVAQCDGAGQPRLLRAACRGAQDVV